MTLDPYSCQDFIVRRIYFFALWLWASSYDLLWTTTCRQKWHCHRVNFKPRPLRNVTRLHLHFVSIPLTQRELLWLLQSNYRRIVYGREWSQRSHHICSRRQSWPRCCNPADLNAQGQVWLRPQDQLSGITDTWQTTVYCHMQLRYLLLTIVTI